MESPINDIIEGCKRGDRKAQKIFYETFYSKTISIVRYYIKDGNHREVHNDGFLRIFRGLPSYSGKGKIESWIFKVMYRTCLDHIKARKAKPASHELIEELDTRSANDTESSIYEDEIMKEFERLPRKQKEIFKMFVKGYPHKEISEILQITQGTSKWHVFTARIFLQKELKKKNLI
jgi:RNA polymerase sigma factor (sigma-70 family)